MVEQLHFHSSKWLFSLSTCELLINIGRDIIRVQREETSILDMLKQRLVNFISQLFHLATDLSKEQKKQINKKSLTIRL